MQNPKWPPEGQKMADGVWKGVHSKVIGRSDQPSLNKFFDPSTPSIRKGRNRGENGKNGGKMSLPVDRLIADPLEHPTACAN